MIAVHYTKEDLVDRESSLFKKLLDAHNRLKLKDHTIWGEEAAHEALIRLDWVDLPEQSRELLPVLDALFAKHRHLTNVVLCGMGGSSLGPEVIAQTFSKELFILDSTDPEYIAHALTKNLESTLVIVGSKSGSTIETASQKSFFEKIFEDSGLNKYEHMIIITDPNSPLDLSARDAGFTVINANPNVGGRFSVLGAFGLVPSALVGIDVSVLLDSAAETKELLFKDPEPALLAAYALITGTQQYFSITDQGSGMPGLSDWIEQLVAESTGKDGVGRLPIVLDNFKISPSDNHLSVSMHTDADLVIRGDLGSQFFFWQWITALVGAGLSIDPFNQPNVQESKLASGALLELWGNSLPTLDAHKEDGAIAFFDELPTVKELLSKFIKTVSPDGYVAIMAYMDRDQDSAIKELQDILSQKIKKPVTFGWGPRFLHSTGQFHKGGQPNGSFLQITAECTRDYEIPGKDFTFTTLLMAQAQGDYKALEARGLKIERLHLLNRAQGIKELIAIARSL